MPYIGIVATINFSSKNFGSCEVVVVVVVIIVVIVIVVVVLNSPPSLVLIVLVAKQLLPSTVMGLQSQNCLCAASVACVHALET